jgi:phosphate transport system substrate-binding protein
MAAGLFIVLFGASRADKEVIGTIHEAGSTTIYPLANKLAAVFMETFPNVNVITQEGGSSVGIKLVHQGKVDIGAASRELKTTEPKLVKHLIGRDGIAIVVHPSNPLIGTTKSQVIDIFSGKISNWVEITTLKGDITVVSRTHESGTRAAFIEMVMGDSSITDRAIAEPSNGAVRALVSTSPLAIGFLSLGYIDATTKTLAIDGVECTIEKCKHGKYPIVRPLYFLTRDEPEGPVKEFINFSLSKTGQRIVTEEGYVSIR